MPFEPINNNVIRPVISSELEPSNPTVPDAPAGHQHGENGWQYFWRELWSRLTGYNDQANVVNNATAQMGLDMAANDEDYYQAIGHVIDAVSGNGDASFNGHLQVDPSTLDSSVISGISGSTGISNGGSSGKTAGSYDFSGILGSSAYQSSQALQNYYALYQATGNEAYLEKLVDGLYNIEAIQSARDWDKMMSDTQYSRMFDDIKASGYNPWIMLQNGSGSGASYSGVSSAKGSSVSASQQALSEANNERSNRTEIISSIIRSLMTIALFAFTKGKTGGIGTKVTNIYH